MIAFISFLVFQTFIVKPVHGDEIQYAQEMDYSKNVTLLLLSGWGYEIEIPGLHSDEARLLTSKSSNPSIATAGNSIDVFGRSPKRYILIEPKKVGKCSISVLYVPSGKIKSRTVIFNVTVKKYTNPFLKVRIGGREMKKQFNSSLAYSMA